MIAEDREYGTFESVTQAYQQIISHTLQLRRYEFETGCMIMFSANSGKCEMLSNGWISMISWTSETDTAGSLTLDICTEGGQCKTYSARGHILCSKNITSISQKNEGKEKVLTICHDNGKLHLTYITVLKSGLDCDIKDQKLEKLFEKEHAERKKQDDDYKKKALKQKDKRRSEQKILEDCDKKDEKKRMGDTEKRKLQEDRRNEKQDLKKRVDDTEKRKLEDDRRNEKQDLEG